MESPVRYQLDGRVATITIDDGKRNAFTVELFDELGAALDRAREDGAVAVLTGREGTFSAGFNTRVLASGGQGAFDLLTAGFEFALKAFSSPMPIVAACGGHALAMGAFVLLSVDFRVGAAGPYKIGANETGIGMIMPWFGVEMSRQRLTPRFFHRSVINAEIYSPEEAVDAGFLDRVVPEDQVLPAARGAAAELARLDFNVHTATKLRAREQSLRALRAAIDADVSDFRKLFGVAV